MTNPSLRGERKRAWLESVAFRALVMIVVGIVIVATAAGSVTQIISGMVVLAIGLFVLTVSLRRRRSAAPVRLKRDMFRRPPP